LYILQKIGVLEWYHDINMKQGIANKMHKH